MGVSSHRALIGAVLFLGCAVVAVEGISYCTDTYIHYYKCSCMTTGCHHCGGCPGEYYYESTVDTCCFVCCESEECCHRCQQNRCRSCQTGYYLASVTTCSKCPANCNSCSSASSCSSCKGGYVGTACQYPCTKPTYCTKVSSCTSTSSGSSICSTCMDGTYLSSGQCYPCPSGHKCYSNNKRQCDANTYSTGFKSECTTCPAQSTSPVGSSGCTCNAGFYMFDNTCRICDAGYRCTGDNTREICAQGQFSGQGSSACYPCPAGSASQSGSGICTCAATTYMSGPSCASCTPGNKCTGNNLQTPCSANTYSEGGTSSCTPCKEGAESAPGSGSCTCKSGLFLFEGKCETCYVDHKCSNDRIVECEEHSTSLPGAGRCTCIPGHYREGESCPSCKRNHFCPGAGVIQQCQANAASEPGSIACTCLPGFYLDGDGETCLPCKENHYCPGDNSMIQCWSDSSSQPQNFACVCNPGFYNPDDARRCLSCEVGFFCPKNNERYPCVENANSPPEAAACECNDGFWRNDAGACVPCHESCFQCSKGDTERDCDGCFPGSFLSSQNRCEGFCENHEFPNTVTNRCEECAEECAGCTGAGAGNCLVCDNVMLGNTCLSECPQDTHYENQDKQCRECHRECRGCTGPALEECTGCFHVQFNGTCVPQCPAFTHFANAGTGMVCDECDPECMGCTDPTAQDCVECRNVKRGDTCLATCDMAVEYVDADRACQVCSDKCDGVHGCRGPSARECTVCMHVRLNGECVDSCPDDMYEHTGDRSCVEWCPSGYYLDDERKKCLECPGGATGCFECADRWLPGGGPPPPAAPTPTAAGSPPAASSGVVMGRREAAGESATPAAPTPSPTVVPLAPLDLPCRECRSGFVRDNLGYCHDIDECADFGGRWGDPDEGKTQHSCVITLGEVCVNVPGGYECDCGPGWARKPNSTVCLQNASTLKKDDSATLIGAGAGAAALVLILLIIVVVLLVRRRKQRRAENPKHKRFSSRNSAFEHDVMDMQANPLSRDSRHSSRLTRHHSIKQTTVELDEMDQSGDELYATAGGDMVYANSAAVGADDDQYSSIARSAEPDSNNRQSQELNYTALSVASGSIPDRVQGQPIRPTNYSSIVNANGNADDEFAAATEYAEAPVSGNNSELYHTLVADKEREAMEDYDDAFQQDDEPYANLASAPAGAGIAPNTHSQLTDPYAEMKGFESYIENRLG